MQLPQVTQPATTTKEKAPTEKKKAINEPLPAPTAPPVLTEKPLTAPAVPEITVTTAAPEAAPEGARVTRAGAAGRSTKRSVQVR